MTDRRLVIAGWLTVPMAVYGMVAPVTHLIPNHAFDKTWPAHAKFHLIWASGKLFAVGTSSLFLALYGLPAKKQWAWYVLVSNFLFGGVSMLLASRIAQGPVPPLYAHDRTTKLVAITGFFAALGLVLAMPSIFRSSAARKQNHWSGLQPR